MEVALRILESIGRKSEKCEAFAPTFFAILGGEGAGRRA